MSGPDFFAGAFLSIVLVFLAGVVAGTLAIGVSLVIAACRDLLKKGPPK